MAFESRNGKGRYYTRSTRVDGRVKRTYVGRGELGEIAARIDAVSRAALSQQATERQEVQLNDTMVRTIHAFSDLLMRSSLVTAGYHRHDRGDWRRRRG